eukprot:240614_1
MTRANAIAVRGKTSQSLFHVRMSLHAAIWVDQIWVWVPLTDSQVATSRFETDSPVGTSWYPLLHVRVAFPPMDRTTLRDPYVESRSGDPLLQAFTISVHVAA